MTQELKKEFTLRISQANRTELSVIIYEILLHYLQETTDAIDAGNKNDKRVSISKARGCLNELIASLHYEYEPAGELLALYIFCSKELVQADLHDQTEHIDHVSGIIKRLRDAYDSIAAQDQMGPVMGNTQTVYAGLTYGRNTLNENVTDPSGNRGFLA